MIKVDQPTIFGDALTVGVSSREDGQMQHGWIEADEEVTENRQKFLTAAGLAIEYSALVRIQYIDGASYDKIVEVSEADAGMGMYKRDGTVADCLVTTTKNLGLFLPIADCGATVVYDPKHEVLALAHLGRHSTVANLARKLVEYLTVNHQTDPSDLLVWISPSISPDNYILEYAGFANDNPAWEKYCVTVNAGYRVDISGYNMSQFVDSGIQSRNIAVSDVDTADSPNYWSHHQQKNVLGELAPPRFAVVASLR